MSESQGTAQDSAKLLLVDDDPEILTVLRRALSTPGVNVITAQTGIAALTELETLTFDAVLSDIQMPAMNGLKLLRAVREYDLDLPVILMTGYPDVESAAAAVEFGVFQYLIKPVEIDRLRAVVARAISAGKIARLKRKCAEEFGSGSFYIGDLAGIESRLNRALESLFTVYQPVVHASNGATFGYEALLRSEEPAMPDPGAILKASARLKRIHEVGRAVRDRVAADIEAVPATESFYFVNVHPEDLTDPALYSPEAALSKSARRVVLELTDRASLDAVPDVVERVERLRLLGYRIALDDLGAGQAGLDSFARLEPEFVKLDSSLIRSADRDPKKLAVIRSLAGICHDMGKTVIAEGVESSEEREVLLAAGCDLMQGFLFGLPGPLARPSEAPRLGVA